MSEAKGVATQRADLKWNVKIEAYVDGANGWNLEVSNRTALASEAACKTFALAAVNRMDIGGNITSKKWQAVPYVAETDLEE